MKTTKNQNLQVIDSSILLVGVIALIIIALNWPICSKYVTQLYLDLLNELETVSSDPYSFF